MSEDIEKPEGSEETVAPSTDADPAPEGAEAAPSTDSPQGSSSADDDTAPAAEVDDESRTSPQGDELAEAVDEAADAPSAEERASEDVEEAPAAEASEDEPAGQAPARAASTPRRQRGQRTRQPGEPAPVVRAQAKYVRSSARKARLVCDHIRGKSVEEARAILAVTPRAIARDWSKLLESAVANAEHNHELVGEDLIVKAVHADEGPTIKRFRPRAMGRATRIRKRTSHLTILLTPKD